MILFIVFIECLNLFTMTLSRSLSNPEGQKDSMQAQTDIISRFLERKFRISRSYPTKNVYGAVIKKFLEFLKAQYNLDLPQMFHQILQTKESDPLEILDQYYTYLSNHPTRGKTGYSNQAINQYIRVAKDFWNKPFIEEK